VQVSFNLGEETRRQTPWEGGPSGRPSEEEDKQ